MDCQVQPNSSTTKRKMEQDEEACRRKSVKKDQSRQIQQTEDGLPESGNHPTNDSQLVSRSSECAVKDSEEQPVKDSQVDKVVVTISKGGLMLRVLLTDHVPYMCPLCGWTFTHAASLKQHGKDVHGYEEAEKMQNGGRGNEIIITKLRVDQSSVLESCFLKELSLPGEDTVKSPCHHPCNICTLEDTPLASEKVTHKGKVATQEKVAHKEQVVHNEKVAPDLKVAHKEKVATKEKVASPQKVARNKKVVPKEKVADKGKITQVEKKMKLSVKAKRGTKNIRNTGNSNQVHRGGGNSVTSAKSSELGIASLLLQALGRKKEADDVIEMQNSSQKNVHAVNELPSELVNCVRKADFEKQKPRRKNLRAVSGLPTESTSCADPEGSLPSDEDLAMTEEEGSGKRKRRKYRPKCSICGFKCDSIAQRYMHSTKVHCLFRNVKEASTYKSKHLNQLQGEDNSLKVNQTTPEPVLHKCPHCTSCSFDPDILQGHLGSHCGAAKGIKCHLCVGAIELWDNDRCEELQALSNKLQEIEDDDQGSGWDRITFSNDGSWSWTGTTSSYSRSVEDDDTGEGVLLKAEDKDAPPAEDKEQEQEGQNKSIPKSRRIKAYPPFVSSCYECGEQFFFRAHAMNHYHRAHHSLTCRDCGTVVLSLTALISHSLQAHKKRGIFRCTHCTQAFHTAGKLHYHLEGHLGLFKCNACDKSFMTLNTLDLHTANYCPGSKEKRAEGPQPITCSICKLDFVRKHAYYKHMSRWHPDEGVQMQLKEKTIPLVCDQCGKFYSNSTSLKTHMKKHRSASPGSSKTFQDKNLNIGASSHEMDLKYICDLCGKKFKSSSLLKSHRIRHLGVLPFKCRFCGKGFLESRRRRLHEWSIHTGECMHQCEVCGKSYATITGLKSHWNTHSSVRPFQCNFCEASFVDKFSLESHLRTHIKPFRCAHCDEVFAQKGGRRRHLFRVHGILEPVPRFRMKIFAPASSSSQLQGIAEPDTQLESEKAASIPNNERS